MPTLSDYAHFDGRHWETGSVHNVYSYLDFRAPHTGKPYSEALLLGVSGGVTFGYFVFAYQGYDPQCNLLTRNTFDPFDRMLSRLGVVQDVKQTTSIERAERYLVQTLEEGVPAILWADMWSLPYNALDPDDGMWGSFPIVVYGYDEPTDGGGNELVHIADRSTRPLLVTKQELNVARGRIKKDKHRLLTLDAPDPSKLEAAVVKGIEDCVKLFTEKPPRGTPNNFGLQGYRHLAQTLVDSKGQQSWAKRFPLGAEMYAGLVSAFQFSCLFGKGEGMDADRGLYAEFLREAATILRNPQLTQVAEAFERSSALWRELPGIMLPDKVAPLAKTRHLMAGRHQAFLQQGVDALDDMREANVKLKVLRKSVGEDFPLTEEEARELKEAIAAHIMLIHDVEKEAVHQLKEAVFPEQAS